LSWHGAFVKRGALARPLGLADPNRVYGSGLVDAAAATSPLVPTPQCDRRR